MAIKIPQKFTDLFEIYNSIQGSDRLERYQIAEAFYEEQKGEKAYDDFRQFSALLNMHYTSSVPHDSGVKGYVKNDLRPNI